MFGHRCLKQPLVFLYCHSFTPQHGCDVHAAGFLAIHRTVRQRCQILLHHGLRQLCGVVCFVQEQVVDGNLVDIPAVNVRQVEQLSCLVLGDEAGVVGVKRFALVKLLIVGDNRVKAPYKPAPEHREELRVDCLLTHPNPRCQDILGINVLRCVSGGAVAVLGNSHDFTRHTEVFENCVSHGNTALNEAEVLTIGAAKLLYIDVAGEGCRTVAVLYAPVLLIPAGQKSVPLLISSVRHEEYHGRCSVVIEEPLLELGGIFVDFHLVRDAFRNTQTAQERVERVQLLHHEHIVNRHGHCQPAR